VTDWYATARPAIKVEGGLKARSTRGDIAQTWWSQRFIEVLAKAIVGGRLQRGRTYARQGQVLSMDVGPGQVDAEVQGSRRQPYRVRIGVQTFSESSWAQVEQLLVENAWYTAALLSGEMPADIEEVFSAAGLSLFPAHANDLSMDCSCPDFAVPCKHIAAVFYLLAESFDVDPFAILAWRGRPREELLANLQAARSSEGAAVEATWPPLEDCLDSFYDLQAEVVPPAAAQTPPDALLTQVPDIGVVVRGRPLPELLAPVYRAASRRTAED
jgi:uncharacterized Zn finger protein